MNLHVNVSLRIENNLRKATKYKNITNCILGLFIITLCTLSILQLCMDSKIVRDTWFIIMIFTLVIGSMQIGNLIMLRIICSNN
jgi:hypothetical protein